MLIGHELNPDYTQRKHKLKYIGDNAKALVKADALIGIELCYCSIYEECWVIDRNNRPTALESCTVDINEMFLQ